MRRRVITLTLIVIFLLALSTSAFADDPGEFFTDAAQWESEFFAESAYWLGRMGIFIGDAQSRLLPQDPLTRAQMAVVLSRMTGQEAVALTLATSPTTWTDDAQIPPWARGYMVLAEAREWFIGHPDGSVGPNDHLTFAQIAMLLARVTDNEDLAVGPWPASALLAADAMELFEDIGPVMPNTPILRGEMVSSTLRAMVADTFMDRDPADGGPGLPLMAQHYSDDYDDWVAEEPTTVTGTWTNYLSASQRITVDGINYPLQLDNGDVDLWVVINDYTWDYADFNLVYNDLEDEEVTLTLNADGEVDKIEAVFDTHADVFLYDVNPIPGEEDYGTIVVGCCTLDVDEDTQILLNGASVTLAALEDAFEDFLADWNTDRAVATVRTFGNEPGDGELAIWISVITDNRIEGEVTGKGTDTTGPFIRLDGVKYYYLAPLVSGDFTSGEDYVLLLDSRDRVRSILQLGAMQPAEFFGMLVDFEVNIDDEGIATFAMSDGTEGQYPYDATTWTLTANDLDLVWYVEHDGADLVTWANPTSVTQVVANEELVTVTATYLQTSDGISTTTVPLASSVFAWDESLQLHVQVSDLIGEQVNVYVDSNGDAGFVITP